MMTKKKNVFVALLLVVAMLTTMIPTSVVKAGATLPTEGFTEVTPAYFGIKDYTDNTAGTLHTSTQKPIKTVDKMLFKTNIIFGDSWKGIYFFDKSGNTTPTTGSGLTLERGFGTNGARLYNWVSGTIYVGGEFVNNEYTGGTATSGVFYDINFGTDIANQKNELAITMEVVDFDHDGTADDMKMGAWINGNLANETYLYFLNFVIEEDEIVFFANAKEIESPEVKPLPSDGFTDVTPEMFGIEDFSGNTAGTQYASTKKPIKSADKMRLKMNIIFGDAWQGITIFDKSGNATPTAGNGITISRGWTATGVRLYNNLGGKIYIGGEFVSQEQYTGTITEGTFADISFGVDIATTKQAFTVTTEVVDFDKDGTADDIKMGMWINDNLVNGTYVYFLNFTISESEIAFLTTANAIDSPYVSSLPEPEPEPEPEEPKAFTQVTPREFGIKDYTGNDEQLTKYSTLRPISTVDGMMFKASMVMGSSSTISLFNAAGDGTTGTGIEFSGGARGFRMYNRCGAYSYFLFEGDPTAQWFYDINLGVDLNTTEINLMITTELVDFDKDGNVNDMKVGIFFDEVLYNNKYLYFQNCNLGEENMFFATNAKSLTSPEIPKLPKPFTDVTPREFGIEDFADEASGTERAGLARPLISPDRMRFKANIVFGDSWHGITIFDREGAENPQSGRGITISKGWARELRIYNNYASQHATVYFGGEFVDGQYTGGTSGTFVDIPTGLSDLTTQAVELAVTTELVDFDHDEVVDDLKIGVYLSGVLYNDTYFYFLDCNVGEDNLFFFTNAKAITSPEVAPLPQPPSVPKNFTEVTPGDFGIADYESNTAQSLYQATTKPITSADEMLFKANVVFGEGAGRGFWFFDATGEGSNRSSFGLFTQENGKLRLSNYYNGNTIWEGEDADTGSTDQPWTDWYYDFTPEADLTDTEVEVIIATEVVDFDNDGDEDDLRICVWLDGKLCHRKNLFVKDCDIAEENIYLDTNVLSVTSPFGYTVQMDITDSLAMNYLVKLNPTVGTPQMTITMKGQDKTVQGVKVEGKANTYKFTFANIMAQDMAEEIEAVLTVGSRTETKNYSVLDYCADLLLAEELYYNDGTAYTEEQATATKELVVDLMQYGAEVQTYRGTEGEELLTAKLAAKVPNYEDFENADKVVADLANLTAVASKLTSEAGVITSDAYAWKSVGLVLNNKVKIRGTFTASDISNLTIKVVIDGVELEKALEIKATSTANTYTVDFDEVYAYEYGKEISFRFYNGATQVGKTLNYSVNTYLKEMSTYSDGLAQLLVAICNYGDAAVAVKNGQ